jgi:hypothetical protein
MTRIIPGVEVQVVKEVLPPQLAPSGILGLVGLTENYEEGQQSVRASSLKRFADKLGPASVFSIPEARLALTNGVFELLISPVKPDNASPASGKFMLTQSGSSENQNPGNAGSKTEPLLAFEARARGTWANGINIHLNSRESAEGKVLDLKLKRGDDTLEIHRNLTIVPNTPRFLQDTLKAESIFIKAEVIVNWQIDIENIEDKEIADEPLTLLNLKTHETPLLQIKRKESAEGKPWKLHMKTTKAKGTSLSIDMVPTNGDTENLYKGENLKFPEHLLKLVAELRDVTDVEVIFPAIWPNIRECEMTGGADALAADYIDALGRLKDAPEVDMVLVAVQDFNKLKDVVAIYSEVKSHCEEMSNKCHGRIGFGQVAPGKEIASFKQTAEALISDRFVLTVPHGVAGAVAGRISSLQYFQSPTFKSLSGVTELSMNLGVEDQRDLLDSNLVPVVSQRGRGIIVLRGLTTDGDQISVRRVADHAVRGVKSIGELFIGRLNNEDGRGALKQKLIEFLIQMEKEGAIVPKTDGSDPAYKIDVYSSQDDFGKGIVRVDLAVRPVRAIDYIYATILVQV